MAAATHSQQLQRSSASAATQRAPSGPNPLRPPPHLGLVVGKLGVGGGLHRHAAPRLALGHAGPANRLAGGWEDESQGRAAPTTLRPAGPPPPPPAGVGRRPSGWSCGPIGRLGRKDRALPSSRSDVPRPMRATQKPHPLATRARRLAACIAAIQTKRRGVREELRVRAPQLNYIPSSNLTWRRRQARRRPAPTPSADGVPDASTPASQSCTSWTAGLRRLVQAVLTVHKL